ncbi:RebB family R body protein [Allosphingosinicella humi]
MAQVSAQITDAVTQANVKVLAEAPAMAMGTIYQALAHSTGMMFENSVNTQQQQNMLQQAATTQGVIQMYSVDTLSDADAATGLAEGIVQILKTRG